MRTFGKRKVLTSSTDRLGLRGDKNVKVLISADMEGTCGVVSWVHVMPPEVVGGSEPSNQTEYDRARRRMTIGSQRGDRRGARGWSR